MCYSLQIILWAASEPDLEEILSDICSLNRVTCWLIFIYIFLTSSWVLDSSLFAIHIFWSVSCMSGSVAAFTSSMAAPSPAPDTTALSLGTGTCECQFVSSVLEKLRREFPGIKMFGHTYNLMRRNYERKERKGSKLASKQAWP